MATGQTWRSSALIAVGTSLLVLGAGTVTTAQKAGPPTNTPPGNTPPANSPPVNKPPASKPPVSKPPVKQPIKAAPQPRRDDAKDVDTEVPKPRRKSSANPSKDPATKRTNPRKQDTRSDVRDRDDQPNRTKPGANPRTTRDDATTPDPRKSGSTRDPRAKRTSPDSRFSREPQPSRTGRDPSRTDRTDREDRDNIRTRESIRTRAGIRSRIGPNSQTDFDIDTFRSPDMGLWFTPGDDGLIINNIAVGGPITGVGFAVGDRILSVNGRRIANERAFIQNLYAADGPNRAEVVVLRDGEEKVLNVDPSVFVKYYQTPVYDPVEEFGIVLDDRYDNKAKVWKVIHRSPAFYAGVQAEDEITHFNGARIETRQEFVDRVVSNDRELVQLEVTRRGDDRKFVVELAGLTERPQRHEVLRVNPDPAPPANIPPRNKLLPRPDSR